MNEQQIRGLVMETLVNEYINPKVSERLSTIIDELTELHGFMVNSEHFSKRDIQSITIANVIKTLKQAEKQIGGHV